MASENFTYNDFIRYQTVPRETFSRLEVYIELLKKWQKTINLISDTTIADVWMRHIIDSTQLIKYIGPNENCVDLGSGAGLPGLVLSIMGIKNMTLVESDVRKSAFLKEAARVTGAGVTIVNIRAEAIDMNEYSLIVARGFAPLSAIFDMLRNTLRVGHKLLLLKGNKHKIEIDAAKEHWDFDYSLFPSVTDGNSVILSVSNIKTKEAI